MNIKIKRALISVSDKTGLIELAKTLARHGVEILSTGGTAKAIKDAGIAVKDVSAHTNFPEMMDGRVKTLHPKIHGGLLGLRDNPEHQKAMQEHDIAPIDMVVVNLYPFESTVAKTTNEEEIIENIDIGGPSMVRSAAKNHEFVAVVVSPDSYADIIKEMDANDGTTTQALRRRLAAAAFARTAEYDAAISSWFAKREKWEFPETIIFSGRRKQALRYGENPHQNAAFYVSDASKPGVASAVQLQGKELSFNNIHDTDAAFELVAEFKEPAVAIIKHANPCGVAEGATLDEAYAKALASDNVSAFGGIIACNRELDTKTAEAIKPLFVEVIIAPKISAAAREIFAAKPNVRLLETGKMPDTHTKSSMIKTVAGGFLIQDRDAMNIASEAWKVVTQKSPTNSEMAEMEFAFKVVKHVKSNAIVVSTNRGTIGVGGGQTSRVDAVRNAIHQAGQKISGGTVLASDAFFPFADNIEIAAAAGIKAIVQPGGSMRDDEVIKAADSHGIAMVFTGSRHFKH